MKSGFKVTNNFDKFTQLGVSAAQESLLEAGKEVLAEIKANAPVKTGELRDSYETNVISNEEIELGSPLERAFPAEFGDSRRAAKPHFTPAIIKSEKILENKLKEKLK